MPAACCFVTADTNISLAREAVADQIVSAGLSENQTLQPIDADAVFIQTVGSPYALAATDGTVLLVWNAPNGMTDGLDDVYGALVRTGGRR